MVAEFLKDRWKQFVTLSTTVLAVCAAISSLKGSSMSTRTQLLATQQTNAWGYFQSKSVKQHISEMQYEQYGILKLELKSQEARRKLEEKSAAIKKELDRYEEEKSAIKRQAEQFGAEADFFKRHGGWFHVAVMLLQIAIMLNSVGALLEKKALWSMGILFGLIGLFFMAAGFWL